MSSDRLYRYALSRRTEGSGPAIQLNMAGVVTKIERGRYCAFCLLNPSTASEVANDATVRKCLGFAQRWGFGGIDVVNLFAYRATDPDELRAQTDPVGPYNDGWILDVAREAELVVLGWGNHGTLHGRGMRVRTLLQAAGITLHCLGSTKSAQPRHPLYVSYDQPLETIALRGVA